MLPLVKIGFQSCDAYLSVLHGTPRRVFRVAVCFAVEAPPALLPTPFYTALLLPTAIVLLVFQRKLLSLPMS